MLPLFAPMLGEVGCVLLRLGLLPLFAGIKGDEEPPVLVLELFVVVVLGLDRLRLARAAPIVNPVGEVDVAEPLDLCDMSFA